MAKRINNKKVLFVLSSVISAGAIATLSGFGINALATYNPALDPTVQQFANQVNPISPNADDLGTSGLVEQVDANLFRKLPTGLERFHFGNVSRGATVTANG